VPAATIAVHLSPESLRWAIRLHELAERVTPLTGRWAQDDILPYISGLQLLLGGIVLAATAAIIALAHGYTRKKIAQEGNTGKDDRFSAAESSGIAPALARGIGNRPTAQGPGAGRRADRIRRSTPCFDRRAGTPFASHGQSRIPSGAGSRALTAVVFQGLPKP